MLEITFTNNEGIEKSFISCALERTIDGYKMLHPDTGEMIETPIEKDTQDTWIKQVLPVSATVNCIIVVDYDTMEILGSVEKNNTLSFIKFADDYFNDHEINLIPIASSDDDYSIIYVERVSHCYDRIGEYYIKL